jgi:hypothetical protein
MAAGDARPQLGSHEAIAAHAAQLRARGRHIEPVLWQGQPAWLKLAVAPPPAWRYHLLAAAAKLLGQPSMQPVRPHGGSRGLQTEAARIRALAAAGLRAPELLDESADWLLLSDLGHPTLEILIRRAVADERLAHWQRGADTLLQAHRAGQYFSQAFSRNFVWSPEAGLGAIDFEDDALAAMPLALAQTRDWLAYCFSTAVYFEDRLPHLCSALRDALARDDAAVRDGVRTALHRTAWLRALRWLPASLQRRDVGKTRCFGELAHLCGQSGGRAPR